jgi:DNA (cytosine-5)-methyltransferase 1
VRAISLFSGAGGFEIGFERAGIKTILQAENDPWCLRVLGRHWPDTERVTDVRSVGGDGAFSPTTGQQLARGIDLIYGGFPCQDVSVAGKRAGFRGERSSLWHEFHRILREMRPRWTVIENVPGLLSSNSGRDFATVLLGLEELGYGWSYRILDARHFGVPQRRRRVFVVGCLGDAARAAQVLAVCESCDGHSAPRRETREDIAPTLDDGARGTSLDLPLTVARSLTSRNERIDAETENFVVAGSLRASDGHHGHSSPRGDGGDNLIAFSSKDYGGDAVNGWSPTLKVGGAGEGGGNPPAISNNAGVRRLTPRECERLMGWPDDWTRYTADGTEVPDSHRYRMCGNGVVSTVAEWLGHRMMWAEANAECAAE